MEFTATAPGVFQFRCNISFSKGTDNCDPDHKRMVGYLIVLK
ncbi:MAG: hypothetical protein ACE5IA_01910 [Dehalococcoidia bacterium]